MLASLTFIGYCIAALVWIVPACSGKRGVRAAACVSFAALALNTAFLGARWQATGHFPAAALYGSLFLFTWTLTVANSLVTLHFRIPLMGVLGSVLAAAISGLAIFWADSAERALPPALRSFWFPIHVTVYFVAYGTLGVAFLASIIHLAKPAYRTVGGHRLDRLGYRLCAFGFPFLTMGLVSGSLWAKKAWGRYWGWDPKETWGLVSWLVYLVYLHLPLAFPRLKNRSRTLSAILVGGFCVIVFTYVGVGGLPESRKSLHVYSETGVDFLLAAVALIGCSLAYVLYNLVVVPFVMRPGKSEKQSPGAPLPKENGAKTANPSADPGNGDSSDGSGVA